MLLVNGKSKIYASYLSFIKYVSISVCVGFTAFIIGTAIGKEKTVNVFAWNTINK